VLRSGDFNGVLAKDVYSVAPKRHVSPQRIAICLHTELNARLVSQLYRALFRSNKSFKQGAIAHIVSVCVRSHRINAIVKAILRLVG